MSNIHTGAVLRAGYVGRLTHTWNTRASAVLKWAVSLPMGEEYRMTIERSIAICVFLNQGRILAAPGYDDVADEHFLRPLGGQIEGDESPEEAVVRELREETGFAVTSVKLLGVIDNRFAYRGEPHHETVHVLDGRFADSAVYKQPTVSLDEPVWEGPALWIDLRQLPDIPIYPEGLVELLDQAG